MNIIILNIREIINNTRLAGQWAPEISLCFSPKHFDYKDTQLCAQAFSSGSCGLKLDVHASKANILLTEVSESEISQSRHSWLFLVLSRKHLSFNFRNDIKEQVFHYRGRWGITNEKDRETNKWRSILYSWTCHLAVMIFKFNCTYNAINIKLP